MAWLPCLAKAIARPFICATRFWAITPRGVERLVCLLIARTVSTFRSQMANSCSMSAASVSAFLSATINSSALVKLWPAPLGRLSSHGPAIFIWSGYQRLPVFHAGELAIVERKAEGIAKGRERSLGRVSLGSFEREFMGFPWSRGLGFSAPTAFSGDRQGFQPCTAMRTFAV